MTDTSHKTEKQQIWTLPKSYLFILLGAGILIRLVFSLGVDLELFPDSKAYLATANALLQGDWSRFVVERTAGYPLFLLAIMAIVRAATGIVHEVVFFVSVVFTQNVLGILIAFITAETSYRLFNKKRVALFSGLLIQCSVNQLFYEHAVLTETLYTFSLLLGLSLVCGLLHRIIKNNTTTQATDTRNPWLLTVGCGLVIGYVVWIKVVGFVLLLSTAIVLAGLKQWRHLMVIACTVFIMMGGWVIYHGIHHHMWAYSAGGGTNQLYKVVDFIQWDSDVEPEFKKELRGYYNTLPSNQLYQAVNMIHVETNNRRVYVPRRIAEPYWQVYQETDAKARHTALEAIQHSPLRYARVTIQEFIRLIKEPSKHDPYGFIWYPLILFGSIGGLITLVPFIQFFKEPTLNNALPWQCLLLQLAVWSHLIAYPILTVTASDIRYRFPLEPILMIFTVYAVNKLWLTWQAKN